jgi:hypothetical protein
MVTPDDARTALESEISQNLVFILLLELSAVAHLVDPRRRRHYRTPRSAVVQRADPFSNDGALRQHFHQIPIEEKWIEKEH